MISAEQIKNKVTTEDIIRLCQQLQGSDEFYYDTHEHPIFNTVLDHPDGDSFKLYYYPETGLFHSYTGSGDTYDIFEMVKRAKQCDFATAYNYIIDFFNFRHGKIGFGSEDNQPVSELGEWDLFQKVRDYKKSSSRETPQNTPIEENMLEYFYPLAAPVEWMKEGISPDVMYHYGIRIDSALSKIIIPHRDALGRLIGIRGRSFDPNELFDGKKYMPVYIQGKLYNHKLGLNLYGLYENQANIRRIKKVMVCEAEKSVLQAASFYGVENCFVVATCGSSLSKEQIKLILSMGVEEVILGYDREFQGRRGEKDTNEYEQKLLGVISPLFPYANVSVIMDYEHKLPYKGSPTDCGREIFEELYHSRVRLAPQEDKFIATKWRKKR